MHRKRRVGWHAAVAGGAATAILVGGLMAGYTGDSPERDTRAAGSPQHAAGRTSPSGTVPASRTKAAPKPSRKQAVAQARAVVRRNGKAIRAAKGETYQARSVMLDPDGSRHVRFGRTYRGLPVLGGDYVIHANADGSLRDATVAQTEPIKVGIEPAVTAQRATSIAARQFTGRTKRTATPQLAVDAGNGKPRLAWRVVIDGTGSNGLPTELNVVVDATTGDVLRRFDGIHTAEEADGTGHGLHVGQVGVSTKRRADRAFELIDPARGETETRDALNKPDPTRENSAAFVDADNRWGSGDEADRATVAVDAHHGLAKAWDYFKQGNWSGH
jgi:Zn-dependent metalloprotease